MPWQLLPLLLVLCRETPTELIINKHVAAWARALIAGPCPLHAASVFVLHCHSS
jgi:hypothetical protein